MKRIIGRELSDYEKGEMRRISANAAVFFIIAGLILLIARSALEAPPSLPEKTERENAVKVTLKGRLSLPPGIEMERKPDNTRSISALTMDVEMPEIPISIEFRGRDIVLTGQGDFTVTTSGIITSRAPSYLNARLRLAGCEDVLFRKMAVGPMPAAVVLPPATFIKRSSDSGKER